MIHVACKPVFWIRYNVRVVFNQIPCSKVSIDWTIQKEMNFERERENSTIFFLQIYSEERDSESERERENWNLKTSFYKDCTFL